MATWDDVHYRGGFYAYCKACDEPMSLRHAHNSDMAICYSCAEGIGEVFAHDDGFWYGFSLVLRKEDVGYED